MAEKKDEKNSFALKVYSLLRSVPKGKVTTYKILANALNTSAYRAIGQVLKKNPYAPEVPCHRVIASDGTIGGFNGNKFGPDIERKKKMLLSEGVQFDGYRIKEYEKIVHKFY